MSVKTARSVLSAVLGIALLCARHARAEESVLLEPTQAPVTRGADSELQALLGRVDTILEEAAQDQGLTLDLSEHPKHPRTEDALIQEARTRWVIAAELDRAPRRGALTLKLVAVPPGSDVFYVRKVTLLPAELEMRIVTMLRDLVEATRGRKPKSAPPPLPEPAKPAVQAHSRGGAVLAVNAALMGGYAGYSLQEASDSKDAHLAYPLIALGAGIGLGGSMLVAEEWNVGVGDAWFLSAGMWWPALSGFMLSDSFGAAPDTRFAYGLLGATAGLTLGSAVLGFGHVSEGDAALVHSGGAFGALVGALAELGIDGSTSETPSRGLGIGSASGLLAAGALALAVEPTASRVLYIDLGASLGALTGAAAASPLLLVDGDPVSPKRNRLWLLGVGVGTLLGGAVGYLVTRSSAPPAQSAEPSRAVPNLIPSIAVLDWGPHGPLLGPTLDGRW